MDDKKVDVSKILDGLGWPQPGEMTPVSKKQLKEMARSAKNIPPWPTIAPGYEFREEALRAASRIVAGMYAGNLAPTVDDEHASPGDGTIVMAEEFARWLEDGKR